LEKPAGYGVLMNVKTDPRARFVTEASFRNFSKLHGTQLAGRLTLSFRLIPPLELDLIPQATWSYGDPRWVYTQINSDSTRTYYTGELDSQEFDVTLRGTYTFTPRLTLQAYGQFLVAANHYSAFKSTIASGNRPELLLGAFGPDMLPAGVSPDLREGVLNVNLVFRWEYLPGSTLMVVYTHSGTQIPYDSTEGIGRINFSKFKNAPASDIFLLKILYLWG
jgi:hypothetical protein